MPPELKPFLGERSSVHSYLHSVLGYAISGLETPPPPSNLDWAKLRTILTSERLMAHFYTLTRNHRSLIPPDFSEALRQSRFSLLLYTDQCARFVRDTLTAFQSNQTPLIVLKGWNHITQLYAGDHGQRYCEDLDILVHPSHQQAGREILASLGYLLSPETRPGYIQRYLNSHAYLVPDSPGLMNHSFSIGLHWGLLHHPAYNPAQIDIDSIFTRALPTIVAGLPTLIMSPGDQIIYLSAHIARQHRQEYSLLRLYESALCIHKALPDLDWLDLALQARQWGLLLSLREVISAIDAHWQNCFPVTAFPNLKKLSPGWQEKFIHAWYDHTRQSPVSEHFLTWLTISGFRRKLSFIREDLFPGRAYLQRGQNTPAKTSLVLAYFARIKRLTSSNKKT